MFCQPELEALLARRAAALPAIDVRRGVEAVAVEQAPDHVVVGDAAGGRVRARFAVGCDGANSTVRGLAGIPVRDLGFFHDWLIVDAVLHEPRVFDPVNLQVCDPARPTTVVSGRPGRRRGLPRAHHAQRDHPLRLPAPRPGDPARGGAGGMSGEATEGGTPRRVPLRELRAQARDMAPTRPFWQALETHEGTCVIAEIKKASPSEGLIRDDFDPVSIALTYERHGAAAISILTDNKFFQGDLAFLEAVRERVQLPLLRKDFMIDERQVAEAVEWGADAILLIVAILTDERMRSVLGLAEAGGLAALVEVHDEAEQREDEERGEDDWVVAVDDRFKAQEAEAIERENGLDEEGTAEESPDECAREAGDDQQDLQRARADAEARDRRARAQAVDRAWAIRQSRRGAGRRAIEDRIGQADDMGRRSPRGLISLVGSG